MRIVNHVRRAPPALAAVVACAMACAASPAGAGEVAGSVVIRGAQASMGGMLGGGPAALESAIGPGSYAGPVLVYVGEAAGALPPRKSAPVRLRMTAAGLTPALQAITVGGVIEFENADAGAHRLLGVSEHGSFDLGWQAGGTRQSRTIDRVGLYELRDGVLDQRLGQLVVLPHGAFVLTDASGDFRLPDLPPGPATIVAYNADRGEVSRRVQVPVSGRVEVRFVF